ncbi:Wall-associated receptor kinase 2 [Carex littledalei]|uniref:Wall-associated receptor kinase 2 n=1 Tax=Carex littledalei TaxID=544730 RepID=A0A833R4K4_9POAL|nr:Wall-associated receptor kinase 2 [Carex littledalei]
MHRISNTHNLLVVIGCNTLSYIKSQRDSNGLYSYDYYTGCLSYCNDSNSIIDGTCSGVGCCQVTIPSGLSDNLVTFGGYSHDGFLSFNPCDYSFLVDQDWFKFGKSNLTMSTNTSVPVWLNWALRENNCAQAQKNPELYGCRSRNSECYDSVNGPGYLCKCLKGYQGNPYLVNGCADINECELPDEYPCHGICHNKEGSYDCKCESGKHGNPFNNSCTDNFPLRERLAIGISASTVILLVVTLSMIFVCQKKRLQRERDELFKELQRERDTFFKKNGGLILYEQLASRKVETMKVFTEEELEKITNNFDTVIGRGGQGMVYKGLLEDNREVAVKKCIVVGDEKMKEEFMNEMIILSQINHRNVVRLMGCCLELDVPMLVYEYIPKGTLKKYLHGNQVHIPLETRLQICTDAAKVLAHLHSETVQPILHGDIKSENILLDNNYMAKVSDFGISRFLSMDKTQIATFVKGTIGYLDPEFMQCRRLTAKSDVYSFGVVILELITRKGVMYRDGDDEQEKSLPYEFLSAMRQNRAEDLFDQNIATEENLKLLVKKVAKIAEKCLRPTGEERPTMTEVAEQLKGLRTALQAMRYEASEFYTGSPRPFPDSDSAPLLN